MDSTGHKNRSSPSNTDSDETPPGARHAQQSSPLVPRCLPFPRPQSRVGASKISEISIYYGTKFGNAERYARKLAHDIMTQRRLRVGIHDLDGFDETAFADPSNLTPSRLYVFVVSTHFAGSPSPSAERFHRWIETLSNGSRSSAKRVSSPRTETDPPSRWIDRLRRHQRALLMSILRRPEHPLKGMQYAVFGIGDSVYLTFNAMGKFVDHKFRHLGATRVLALGLGDCSNGLHTTFEAWETSLLHRLPRRRSTSVIQGVNFVSSLSTVTVSRRLSTRMMPVVPLDALRKPTRTKLSQTRPEVGSTASAYERDTIPEESAPHSPATSSLTIRDNFNRSVRLRFRCRVLNLEDGTDAVDACVRTAIKRNGGPRTPREALFDDQPFGEITPVESVGISSSYSGSVLRERASGVFRIRLLQPETTYATVSTLAIFPYNSRQVVEEIAEAFGFELDAVIELTVDAGRVGTAHSVIQARRQQLPFPTPCSVRVALTEFLELRTVTRDFLRIASGFVATTEERELLESLADINASSTAFRTQIKEQHKGILDLVAMAPTLQIPLEVLLSITPTMKPRYYTIGSSPLVSPSDIDIAVALGSPNEPRGLGASFFADVLAMRADAPLVCRGFISASRFQFHDDGVAPMVFIATGVGLTAMRAIIQERLAKRFQNPAAATPMPKHLLFLGAANEDSLVFSNDLRHWEQQLVVKVHFAFSNDRRHTRQYVQDVVEARIDEVVETVTSSNGSRIFVCGRTTMVRRIRELFQTDQMRRRSRWFDTVFACGRFIEEGFE